MCLFPISTPFFHPTGTKDLFCLFRSSYEWNHRADTGLQLHRSVGTVPLQFTGLVSLNKVTQVVLYNPKLKRNETQVDLQQRMTWNHGGPRESESKIRRSQAWVEWDGQSPIEGEGLFLDQRDSKRTGTKKQGWWQVPVGESQSSRFTATSKAESKQTGESTARAGWDQPQCPESLHLPQETRRLWKENSLDSWKEESTKNTWSTLSSENFLLWTISNKHKTEQHSKHPPLSFNNYQHSVSSLFIPPHRSPLIFYTSFSAGGNKFTYIEVHKSALFHFDRRKHLCNPLTLVPFSTFPSPHKVPRQSQRPSPGPQKQWLFWFIFSTD